MTEATAEPARRNEQKWTKPLWEAGWAAIPTVLLERQRALGLDATDMNIILHLVRHWWHADALPFPSKRAIAECMNVNVTTVRRHIARLEADGLVRRERRTDPGRGQLSNAYDLSGLIAKATPFANELLEERKRRQEGDAERRMRKRPRPVAKEGT